MVYAPQPVFISVFRCNQSSPPGICCRVSVGVSRLRQELRRCAVVWKLRRGAHLLLPGVSADIKRSGPLTSAWLTAQRELTTVCVSGRASMSLWQTLKETQGLHPRVSASLLQLYRNPSWYFTLTCYYNLIRISIREGVRSFLPASSPSSSSTRDFLNFPHRS